MSTQMSIARRIFMGNQHIDASGADTKNTIFDFEIAKNLIKDRQAALFDIGVAFSLSHQGEGIRDQTEPIKPPYPLTWMEWQSTDTKQKQQHCASLIIDTAQLHDDFPADIDGKVLFLFYLSIDGAPRIANMACGYAAELTSDGKLLQTPNILADRGLFNEEGRLDKTLEDWIYHGLCTVLLALSLINCKNVSTQEVGALNIKRSATEKRRGMPARKIKYHTIMLPGGGSESDGQGGHRATAIHRVRGHFKTFTAERPLMGQHVGTYWWGWQVRGNPEKGMVVSDYSLEGASNGN